MSSEGTDPLTKGSFVVFDIPSTLLESAGKRRPRPGVHEPDENRAGQKVHAAAPEKARGRHGGKRRAHDERAERGHPGSETDHAARLPRRHDHGHLLEGPGVADTREEEHRSHRSHESVKLARGVGGEEHGRDPERDGHAHAGDKSPDAPTESIAQRSPRHAHERRDQRAQEPVRHAIRQARRAGELRGLAKGVVDEEREMRREAREGAEGHQVDRREEPGVLVAEDVDLLAQVRLDRHILEEREGEDDGDDRPRHEHQRDVGKRQRSTVRGDHRRDEGGERQGNADDPGGEQLDKAHAEVADPGLDPERRSSQAPREKVARRRHVAGEGAAADPARERQKQQHPVGRFVVLDSEEPTDDRDEKEHRREADELPRAENGRQEHVDQPEEAGREPGGGSEPVEL